MENLFASIRIVKSHQERRSNSRQPNGILFTGQEKYVRYPLKPNHRACRSPISQASSKPQYGMPREYVWKRCFNSWTTGYPVRSCKEPRNEARIKKKLGQWKRIRGLPSRTTEFTDLKDLDVETCELNEAFMALLPIWNDGTTYQEHIHTINSSKLNKIHFHTDGEDEGESLNP